MPERVSYSKDIRAKALEKGTGLLTVDVRSPKPGKGSGGCIKCNNLNMEQLDWLLAFAIHVSMNNNTPQEAWDKTYGSPNCPASVSGGPSNGVS